MIVWVRVVLKRTVVGDWHFDNLSGSHLQSQVNSICQSMMLESLLWWSKVNKLWFSCLQEITESSFKHEQKGESSVERPSCSAQDYCNKMRTSAKNTSFGLSCISKIQLLYGNAKNKEKQMVHQTLARVQHFRIIPLLKNLCIKYIKSI